LIPLFKRFISKCSQTSSVLEREESLVIRLNTSSSLEEVDKGLSLSCEAVHYILRMVSDGSFEEE
jgi:hypothetical protein